MPCRHGRCAFRGTLWEFKEKGLVLGLFFCWVFGEIHMSKWAFKKDEKKKGWCLNEAVRPMRGEKVGGQLVEDTWRFRDNINFSRGRSRLC